jgi:hypothetical protein
MSIKNSKKSYQFSHTPRSQKGLGDFYGTGITAKIGKMRDDSMGMQAVTPPKMKKPPKSLA